LGAGGDNPWVDLGKNYLLRKSPVWNPFRFQKKKTFPLLGTNLSEGGSPVKNHTEKKAAKAVVYYEQMTITQDEPLYFLIGKKIYQGPEAANAHLVYSRQGNDRTVRVPPIYTKRKGDIKQSLPR